MRRSAVAASRCSDASSIVRMGAGAARARAMSRRRRSPPDTVVPPDPMTVSIPSGSDSTH